MSGAGFDMIWNSSATETLGANTTNNNFIFHHFNIDLLKKLFQLNADRIYKIK